MNETIKDGIVYRLIATAFLIFLKPGLGIIIVMWGYFFLVSIPESKKQEEYERQRFLYEEEENKRIFVDHNYTDPRIKTETRVIFAHNEDDRKYWARKLLKEREESKQGKRK